MSRIGKEPISFEAAIAVNVDDDVVKVKGPKGELSYTLPVGVRVKVEGNQVIVDRANETKVSKSLHGLSRSLIANMVEGVSKGFSKGLEIQGVGFRGAVEGTKVSLWLGFASAKTVAIPDGLNVEVEGNGTVLTIRGIDKQKVGHLAAHIRSLYPAEPYKGKGVRYKGEQVRRKVGKTVA